MAIPEPIEFRRQAPPRPQPVDPAAPCRYAEDFAAYCEALLSRLAGVPPADLKVGIADAKRELLDRYADFLTDTPAGHANTAGRKKHRCIVDVLNDAAREIRLRERVLPPPKLAARERRGGREPHPRSWVEELAQRAEQP